MHTSKPDQQSSVADETLLQFKVDQRLQELSDLAKSGNFSKIKSQRGGPVDVLIKIELGGPMNTFYLASIKNECHTTSST